MPREQHDDLQAAEGDLLDQSRDPWEESTDPDRPSGLDGEPDADGSEGARTDADTADVVDQTREVPQDDELRET